MLRITCFALLALVSATASAQTVRFQTSVGAFDMLLNPTNNPDLQPLVDNMLANVAAGVYRQSVVNRAPQGFVLQLGGFVTDNFDPDAVPVGGFAGVDRFDGVIVDADNDRQVDFDTTGLSNTEGTVSLALGSDSNNLTDLNSGTSSFFINLGDNTNSLDPQGFVPFATIADMTVVNQIVNGTQVDLSSQVGQPGSLAYIDVPLDANGELIYLETVSVISESNFSFIGPLQQALGIDDLIAEAATVTPTSSSIASLVAEEPMMEDRRVFLHDGASAAANSIPEPSALLLALGSFAAIALRR